MLFRQRVGFCVAVCVGENHSRDVPQDSLDECWVAAAGVLPGEDVVALSCNCAAEVLVGAPRGGLAAGSVAPDVSH